MQKNVFDLVLTAEEQTQIDDALKVLNDVLLPKLQILTGGKKDLLNMGDKSIGFVDKAYEVARQETDLLGGFIDLQAFDHDVAAIDSLRAIKFKLSQLHSAVEDSFAVAGSEGFNNAVSIRRICQRSI